jgi:hypothetical protein
MMGAIDELFAETISAVAFDADLFPGVETITYTPYGGSPKSIKAIVNRQGIKPTFNVSKSKTEAIEIWIQNDATLGVTTIDQGSDRVTMKPRLDKPAREMSIGEVFADSDQSTWHISVK